MEDIDAILQSLNLQEKAELLRRLLGPLAVDVFSHKQAAYCLCHAVRGAAYKDIAKEFGCSVNSVDKVMTRAKRKLEQCE